MRHPEGQHPYPGAGLVPHDASSGTSPGWRSRVPAARPILVVEDHADTRDMLELFLRQAGYPVSTAADGVKALESVARETPCLILLDVAMPVMDGPAFARRLRELPDRELAQTPIILLTAMSNPADAMRETGAVGLIPKPVSLERIVDAAERHSHPPSGVRS